MRVLWILFAIGVVATIFVLSEAGQALIVFLMITDIVLPLAMLLMLIPLATVLLGIFLVTRTLVARLPRFRHKRGLAVSTAVLALVGIVLTGFPLLNNLFVDAGRRGAVATNMPLAEARPPGLVVGLRRWESRKPIECGEVCAGLLVTIPEARGVLGRFEGPGDTLEAGTPGVATTWALGPAGIDLCPWPINQAHQRCASRLPKPSLTAAASSRCPRPTGST